MDEFQAVDRRGWDKKAGVLGFGELQAVVILKALG